MLSNKLKKIIRIIRIKLYKKEQDYLVNKIINILKLDNENSIILYNLYNDKTKKYKIL